MLVSKNKGETLIETLVAIFVATISIIFLVSIQGVSYNSKKAVEQVMEGTYRLESIKKIVLCNLTYDEMKRNFNSKTKYVNLNGVENQFWESQDILSIIDETQGTYPRIEISGKEGEGGTMIIDIKYIFENGEYISNLFYRGNYEERKI